MKTILIVLSSVLLFTSCKQEDEPQQNNTPGSTNPAFTATLHDTSFTGNYFSNSYPGPLLQLYAYDTVTQRSVTITVESKNTGTYAMTTILNGTSASCQGGGGIGYYSIHGGGHGSVTISSSSASSVSGNFSFTGYNLSGTDSAAVSGQFSNMTF